MSVRSHQHGYAAENINPYGLEALQLERIVGHQLHALGYGGNVNAARAREIGRHGGRSPGQPERKGSQYFGILSKTTHSTCHVENYQVSKLRTPCALLNAYNSDIAVAVDGQQRLRAPETLRCVGATLRRRLVRSVGIDMHHVKRCNHLNKLTTHLQPSLERIRHLRLPTSTTGTSHSRNKVLHYIYQVVHARIYVQTVHPSEKIVLSSDDTVRHANQGVFRRNKLSNYSERPGPTR